MAKCEKCREECPDKFLQPLYANAECAVVDPECALAIINNLHGVDMTEFTGTMAQQLLEDFREWKEKHG